MGLSALLIVDFQNDFVPGGALAAPGGDEIAEYLNDLTAWFDLVVATRDWHPPNHSSFQIHGGPWPVHCVQETKGAELHKSLDRTKLDAVIDKGQNPATGGYSGFEETELAELLRSNDIDSVTIVGLVTDICVRHTALDALREGFSVTVDTQGTVAIDPDDSQRALQEIRDAGGKVL